MAYAVLTHTSAGATSLFGTVTSSAIDTTGADFLVMVQTGGAATVADSMGNTWIGLTTSAVNTYVRIWICIPSAVGAGHVFTVTGGVVASLAVAAFSSAKQVSPLDQENGTVTAGGDGSQTGPITPTQAGELLIAGCVNGDSGGATGIDSGFTILENLGFAGGQHRGVALAYQIQTTATTRNPIFTVSSPGDAVIASFFKAVDPYVSHMLVVF